ncbi:SDR family NAD(P)-dependent oxidoreductase [Streptomyces olivaceus]
MNDPIECHLTLPHDDFIMQNHRIHQVSVMPGATFLDIVYRILRAQGLDTGRAVLRDVLFAEPIATAPGRDLAVRVTVGAPDATGTRSVAAAGVVLAPGTEPAAAASAGLPWRPHFSARLEFTDEPPPPPIDPRALLTRAGRSRDMAELYRQARAEDIQHGPPMQGFGELHHLDSGGLLARLELDPGSRDLESAFHLHPAKLDAATLVTFGHRPPPGPDPFIPVHIAEFRAPRAVTGPCWVHVPTAETVAPSGDVMHNDCLIYDEQGRFVAQFTKLSCKRVRHAGLITRLLDAPGAPPEPSRSAVGTAPGGGPQQRLVTHLRTLIGDLLGRAPDAVDPRRGFYELGLDSVALLTLSAELEKAVDGRLYPTLLFEHPDVASVAHHVAQQYTVTLPDGDGAAVADEAGGEEAWAAQASEAAGGGTPLRPTASAGPVAAPAATPASGFHRCHWVPLAAVPAPRPSGVLLVVTADSALADAVRHRATSGRRTVHVLPAPAYERTGPDTWRVPTGSRAGFDRLLDELAAEDVTPAVLAVCPAPAPGPAADTADGYDTVWALAGALAGRPADTTRDLRFLYRAEHEDEAPQHSAVGALARGITAENPALRCRSTLVTGRPGAADLADILLAEAADAGEDSESRHRDGERHVRRLVPHLLDGPDAPALPREAVCLVTGGAGGIGSLLAEHLAGTRGARLVLCGTREADATVTALLDRCAARGGEAHYVRADVSRPEDAEAAAARCHELYGRIDAVFHCAGRTDDALHFRRDADGARTVLAPKLAGTLHLDRATAAADPALFVLFSSLSAVLPHTGQCAYGYANAFLDAFAGHRAADPARTGRTLSLAWPYWAEGGMRAGAAALARSAESGMRPLPTRTALDLLDRCMAAARPGTPARLVAVHTDGSTAGPLTTGLFAPVTHRTGMDLPFTDAPVTDRPATEAPVRDLPVTDASVTVPETTHPLAPTQALTPMRASVAEPGPTHASAGAHGAGTTPGPIAVIGVAGRYPGAADLDAFWANLAAGRDCVTEVPAERWDHDALYDPEPGRPGRTYGRWGGFLAGMDRFDPLFFGISRREAERMDPQERLFLTIAWQTLEDAGHPPGSLAKEQVGVFAGVMWNHFQFVTDPDDETAPVALHSSVANRVSYTFDFRGPSIAVDTACSSSLTAVQLAVESLRRGESTLALAGGVNLMPHPQKYLQLARGRWLSRDGRCRAFGEGGTGYVPGEGVGAVLLKPLERALADGDHIHAVIRAARTNHSGRTGGFTVPSPTAQAALVADAVRESGADVRALGYVEAHGTGTSLGDPIELQGLRTALAAFTPGPDHVAIGSVKTNIGHLESAAGIAGLTKVLLQFRHGALAPSLHADTLNPHLDFGDGRVAVQRGAAPWPRPSGGRRLAGISAFGAGGSNAHLVVEEAPGAVARPAPRGPRLFLLSAKDERALRERASALLAHLTPAAERSAEAVGSGGAVGSVGAVQSGAVRRSRGVVRSEPAPVRLLVARRLAVPEASLGGGETFEDLGLDPAGRLALAHDLAVHTATEQALPTAAEEFAAAVHAGTTLDEAAETWAGLTGAARADEDGLPRPDDLAHTLRAGRTAMPVRFAVVADGLAELRAALERLVEGAEPGPRAYRGTASSDISALARTAPGTGPTLEDRARRWVTGDDDAAGGPEPDGARARRVPLPGYPFREERCWPGGWSGRTPAEGEAAPRAVPPSTAPAPAAPSRDDGAELVVLDGGIGLIRMRSPMFTDRLLHDLREVFDAVAARADVKAVVVTGCDGVFSMGGTAEALETLADGEGRFTDQAFVYEGLLRCDRPVVAAIDGHASGGGLAFGLYADVVLLAEDSVYSANFVAYGFTPGMGATYVLERRFGSALADEMMLTGRPLTGAELHHHGAMVTVLPSGDVLPAALDRARALAARPEGAVRRLKRELADRVLARLDDVVGREVRMHEEVLGAEARDGVRGHFARVEAFRGAGSGATAASGPALRRAPEPEAQAGPGTRAEPAVRPESEGRAESVSELIPASAPEAVAGLSEEEVRAGVVASLAQVLYLRPEEIDDERTFAEMGLDSIGAVEVVRELNERHGTGLEAVLVYDHPTVPAMTAALLTAHHRTAALHRAALEPTAPAGTDDRKTVAAKTTANVPRPTAPAPTLEPALTSEPTPAPAPALAPATEPASPPAPPGLVTLRPVPRRAPAAETKAAPGEREQSPDPDPADPAPVPADPVDPPEAPSSDACDIAVIGMSGRFPGADDLDAFWENLEAGRVEITEVPPERWDTARWYDPNRSVTDRTDSKWAALVSGADEFDPAFFRLSPLEAEAMDPQQRLFLQEAWKALENTGYGGGGTDRPTERGTRDCGVFVGCGAGDYTDLLTAAGQADTGHAFLGSSPSVLAARISYFLDLTGPTLAVDTACSSSLTAVHLACESLRRGECRTALAGGVALMLTPRLHIRCSNAGMLSPTGTSAPFDARADGIVLGEGVGVVVLKPLAQAVADGDHIHGVIRATGVNGDGRTNGMTAPSAAAQTELLRRVHRAAGVTGADIGYVEAHGTGTSLGDPIEVKALQDAFHTDATADTDAGTPAVPAAPTVLGSVKANIGHTTMAAGIAGLLKVLLALRHRRIPPTPHFSEANPEIDLSRGPFRVLTSADTWHPGPRGTRIATLSSFGFSGTNAHAVIAEAPPRRPAPEPAGSQLVPVSARDGDALSRSLTRLADALDAADAPALADVARTLGTGRTHFPLRAAFVVRDRAELVTALRTAAARREAPYVHAPATGEPALRRLAETYAHGGTVDWAALRPDGGARRVPLPTYPFARDRHWVSGVRPKRAAFRRSEEPPDTPAQSLDPRDPVVADHRLGGRAVLPGVAGLSLAVRSAARYGIVGAVRVSQVQWLRPVAVDAARDVRIRTREHPAGGLTFELTAGEDDGVQAAICTRGRIQPLTGEDGADGPLPVEAVRDRCPTWHPGQDLYAAFAAGGLVYGPAYQALEGVWAGTDEALGVLRAPDSPVGEETSWPLSPAVLDAALQTLTVLARDPGGAPLVPFALRALEVRGPLPLRGHAHATRAGAAFTVRVTDPEGRVRATFEGVALRPLPVAAAAGPGRASERPETVVLVPRLREAGALDRAASPDGRPTWLFHTAAARPLAETLAGSGRQVTAVALPGADATASFEVPDGVPDTVYWLALHDPAGPAPGPGPDPATLGLFRLLKILLARGAGSRRLTLKVALSGAVADEERGPLQPHSAGLIGLTRSAAAEYPKWRAGCVDLPAQGSAPAGWADLLSAEPCAEPLVVLRGARRLVRGLVPAPAPQEAGTGAVFREGGTYVVIGGTGGIGTALARHLARAHRARLVLVGRRPQDDSVRALLAELDALGGSAAYVRGDVADPAEARRIVAEARDRAGRADGVFHSALVLRDRTLAAMDEATFLGTLAVKTNGLTALADALADEPPGFLVCFSSAVSFADAPGQANYAAASTFEDAYAGYLRERSFPASVVNWGFWGSVGVVAQERRVERFAGLGIGSLEPAEGIDALTHVLGTGLTQAVVVKGTQRGLALLGTGPDDAVGLRTGPDASTVPGTGRDGTADSLTRARAGFDGLERVAATLLRARLTGTDGDPVTALGRWTGRHPEGSAGARLLGAVAELLRRPGADSLPAAELVARHPAMRPHVTLLQRCVEALPEVLDGTRPPTDVLFPGGSVDLVEAVYRGQPLSDHHHRLMAAETVAELRRHRPAHGTSRPLRILEIGAGTGAGTAFVLDALDEVLRDPDGPPPVTYTYTDVSPAFLAHGEREFGPGRPYLSFRTLDIERPPAAQGLPPHGYDLVLATNVLHATADIGRTLAHVRELLALGGTLLVDEVTRTSDFLTLTFGLTPGWWAFRDTERRLPHSPLLEADQWHRALTATGFEPVRTLGLPGTSVEHLGQCVFAAGAAPEAAAPGDAHVRAHVRRYVRGVFAEVLKFDPGALADDVTFENYGVDSLVSLRIINRLEEDFGDLPATLLFERLTIARLADHFVDEHGKTVAELPAPEPFAAEPFAAEPLAPAAATTTTHLPEPPPSAPAAASDIAVIGVGGRYPGAPDLNTFWHNLASGTASFTEVPAERWDWRPTFDARRGTPQRTYSRWGAFLDGIDRFDPAFFGILGRDAAHIDPQERLFLETAWNLLEESGHLGPDTHEPDTGVFVGVMYCTYGQLAAAGWPQGRLSGAHSAHWSVANRVSYFFDFQGPSLAVDSACSSSLTAVHLACESLRRGECRTAVAGGVSLILHPAHHVSLSALNMLSADDRCKVFDAGADGFVPGEGVGAVLLKPLDRAVADGDRIWAVIKGGGMNAGGKTGGYTVPNPNAQAALVRRVLEGTGVPPETVSYVECHGTGTALGDPIEIAALGKALGGAGRAAPCAVGSVKSNIGHLEGAAGIAGLTKLLLQLRHRRLAPAAGLTTLNPRIDFDAADLEPVRTLTDWPAAPDGTPRRAGISSFGAGGANTHLVLEEYLQPDGTVPEDPGPQVFLLSARSAERLRVYAGRVADHLAAPDGSGTALAALARTSQTGRRHFPDRLAVVCAGTDRLAVLLRSYADTGRAEVPGLVVGRAGPEQGDRRHGPGSALLREARSADPAPALAQLGRRWVSGGDVDWTALWEGHAAGRVPYPTYPFDRTRHWLETGVEDPTLGGPAARPSAGQEKAVPAPVPEPVTAEVGLHRLAPTLEACSLDTSGPADPPRRVLLLGPDSAVRRALAEEFARRGVDCQAVSAADAVPVTPDGLRRFVAGLADRAPLPDALVLACPPAAGPPEPDTVTEDLDAGPHLLLWTAAALLARGRRVRLRTAVAHGPTGRQPQFSATGALLKSLALEHSGCTAVTLGFETYDHAAADAATAARIAAAVADELARSAIGVTETVHDRDGRRHLRRLTERPAPPGTPDTPLPVRAGGTYLVTGGAGALGRILGGFLADAQPVNLVLAGRSPLDADLERRTAELWRGGSTVWYRPTDLASAADVTALITDIRSRYGTLNGIVHAAGVHRDARAVLKTAAEAAEVLGPKVTGTVLLDHATRDDDLDFFVLCASLVGETGNLGQTDYAYANAFQLDFAEARERLRVRGQRPGHTVAIGWPLWEDGGMAVDDVTRRLFAQLWSMAPLGTETGLTVFRAALTGTEPRWLPVERTPAPAIPTSTPAAAPVEQSDTDAPSAAVRHQLRVFTAEFLVVDPDEVDTATELMDLGFDSISLSELTVRVNDHYGLELLPTVLFEHPTLDAVAGYLSAEHPLATGAVHTASTAPRDAAVARVPQAVAPEPAAPALPPPAAPASGRQDVAVIGMAGRLPGSPDLDAFWRHLSAGDDLVVPVPPDRADLLADPATAGLRGGFLADVADFDAAFFRISPAEARLMDPQHRLFLETVWRAFEDAGYRPEDRAGTSTGVFVGMATSDYGELITRSGADPEAHMATGVARSLVANRVSHLLDLRGPSETVDTACSSSLVALHRAVGAVAGGECDEAIVGGVSLALSPGLFQVFERSGMLSPAGRCRTFDKDADGYVRGEGAGAVLLKPLERAEADGDRILAVVRGSAVNHCGRSPSLTAPNPRAQADVVVRAHRVADVSPATVTYVETHGTGTRLGDPIEAEGLKDAFTRRYADTGDPVPAEPHVTLGSVKTNIGHLEAAAGIAGLLKVLLALRHRTLPAHLHLREANPYLRLAGTPFRIGTTTTPWEGAKDEHGRPRWRAGISSFGFGGTNAHVVLEAWTPPEGAPRPEVRAVPRAEFQPRGHWFTAPTTPRPAKTELPVPHPDQEPAVADTTPAPTSRRQVRLQPLDALAAATPSGPVPAPPTAMPDTAPPAATPPAPAPPAEGASPSATGIRATVRVLIADVLGLAAADLADDASFAELGLDSIFRMDVARALNDEHGLDLQGAELYEHDTIAALADHVRAALVAGPARTAPRELPASPAPTGRDDARAALRQVLEHVLGRSFEPAVTFEDNGFTSFDMLRGVSALEAGLGALPKALLFERPTLDQLTDSLCETHGERTVAGVRPPAQQPTPAPAPALAPAPATRARLLTRTEAVTDPELAPALTELERRHGKESGLGGRDIAPYLFVGADRRGFFALSQRDGALLVWNYTGPEDHFAELAGEFFDHARRTGLRPNLLSLVRLTEVGGDPVTATPFGALQRIEDLGSFKLSGGRMSRLRYMVKRLEKAGACRTAEYRSGDDPSVDAELAALVDGWAATKQMVNPYVRRVREELADGKLDERHRLFLTYLDDTLVNAVVVTRIPSENGYLLDVEFYPDGMPLGGLEFALVRILDLLREEGCEVFSFGASFGGEMGTSPNASDTAVRALAELRDAGVFGGGNYQFKNKFRPENRTLYLVQPEGERASEVNDVILMIADPTTPTTAGARTAGGAPTTSNTPAPEPSGPQEPALNEPAPDRARLAQLAVHGHNPVRLPHLTAGLDLVTDSWADRADPWQRQRARALAELADAAGITGEEPPAPPWLPFAHRFLAASGRSAEERLCRAWPGPRGRVLHTSAFPTWLGALAEHGFDPSLALPVVGEGPFPADLRLTALEEALDRYADDVSFVLVETATNAHGGAPLSLENLRGVAERTRARGVPLLLDATRLLDNALLVAAGPDSPARDPWEVAREMLGLARAVTFSLSKDFGVDGGGLIATSDERLAERLTERTLERGREPGLSARRLLCAALLDQESTTRLVTERVANVAAFRQRLELGGVPLAPGPSAHCVLIDVDRAAGRTLRHPVASYLAGGYAATGVRGGPHLTPAARLTDGSTPPERHLIRLAVPLGMDRETLERAADRLAEFVADPASVPDLTEVPGGQGPAALRPYHPTDELPADIREAFEAGSAPAAPMSENHAVLTERAPGTQRHLLPMPGGTVEVFDCGSGPAVLMLPPFNIGGGVFADQVAGLADRHRTLVVHHPGVGATTSADDISLPGMADLYRDVLDRLGVSGPVHVVGTSFGGLLAQSFVLAHPGRARSLALVCSSYRYANRVGEVNLLADLVAEDLDRIAAAGGKDVARHRDAYTARLLRCESMAPHIGLRYLDVFAQQPDLLGRLADIAVPTLVVAGGVDAVVPRKTSHLMHGAIPDARYLELPLAGHFPTVTDPDGVTAALAAFLAEAGEETR